MLHKLYQWRVFWALLVVAMVGLRFGLWWLRYHFQRGDDIENVDLDLGELQKLVAKGLMTQEEYQRARDVIVSRRDAKLPRTDARFERVKGFPVLPVDQTKPKR